MTKHFLQTKSWANVREAQGQKAIWLDNEQFMLIKKLPFPLKNIGFLNQIDVTKLDFERLKELAKDHNLSHIYIEPNNSILEFKWDSKIIEKYNLHATKTIMLRHTLEIDLTKDEETLLSEMDKNTRYNIRYSLRNGVTVNISEDDADFETFLKVFFATKSQKYFFARDISYYRSVWKTLKNEHKVRIAVAKYNDEPLVVRFLFVSNDTIFTPYTGYSSKYTNLKATYGIVWEMIKWGKSAGLKKINMWGIKPYLKPQDQEFGYTKFKMNFSKDNILEYAPCYDMIVDPFSYKLFNLLNKGRWLFLKIKKRLQA